MSGRWFKFCADGREDEFGFGEIETYEENQMKLAFALSAAIVAASPGVLLAQTATPADPRMAPPAATVAPGEGRSAIDSPEGPVGTSGNPSDITGTPSMAPSSGNAASSEPDPGSGRGNK